MIIRNDKLIKEASKKIETSISDKNIKHLANKLNKYC